SPSASLPLLHVSLLHPFSALDYHLPLRIVTPVPPYLLLRPPSLTTPLFPYTTLFRSVPKKFRYFRHSSRPTWSTMPSASTRRIRDRSTRLNSSHVSISYAVFCLKKKKN